MKRIALVLLFWLAVGLGAGCAAYRYQHARTDAPTRSAAATIAPVPPSAEFEALADEQRVARLRGEVEESKRTLAAAGKYNCCIRPACSECLLDEGECHCREMVETMGPGCGECTEGWIEGRGQVEGVDIWQVLEERVQQHRGGESSPASNPPG